MKITLSSEDERLVEERVASGEFESPEALVHEAVTRLLREDEEEFLETKAAIEEALEQSRRGESRPAVEVFEEFRAEHRIPR